MTAEQTTRIEKMETELHEQRQIFIQGKSQGRLCVRDPRTARSLKTVVMTLFQKWEKYEGFYWDQEGLLVNPYHQILLAIHFEPCAYTPLHLNQLSMMTNKDKNVNLEIQWPIIDFIVWTHHDHRELIGQSNYIKNQ